MRIDKLLWFLRLAKSRSSAQTLVGGGHIRLNGRRIERAAQAVAVGDILTLPLPQGVIVIALDCLPQRRGPADEAQACYRTLDGQALHPIAAAKNSSAEGDPLP